MTKRYRDPSTGQSAESVPTRHETPDVAELRRLAEAATPGPWSLTDGDPAMNGQHWTIRRQGVAGIRISGFTYGFNRDAAYIVAAVNALPALLDGRCLSDITHRDEDHRQSFCMLPADHAPLAHDDCMGCTWTDADHWQPSAIDRLAGQVEAVRTLHRAVGIYDECDCDDADPATHLDVDEVGLTCNLMYRICAECCRDDVYQTEDCANYHAHRLDEDYHCPTIRAIGAES